MMTFDLHVDVHTKQVFCNMRYQNNIIKIFFYKIIVKSTINYYNFLNFT